MLDIVYLSAHVIYREKGGKTSRLDFQLTLAERLSAHGGTTEPPAKDQPSKTPKATSLTGCCFLNPVPETKQNPTGCIVCWLQRKRNNYWCPDCKKALCSL
jgi:hypothetical protein